jgi:hypothetical protein
MTTTDTLPVPRWADLAAHTVVWTTVPSGLWRVALGLGVPVGFSGELAGTYEAPGWAVTPYVIVLSLAAEGLALLTLGLVRPWGERVPRWLPLIGGRAVPTAAAATAAALGAIAVTGITVVSALGWSDPENMGDPDAPQGLAGLVMTACYAPLLAWGPLLAAVTVAYVLRRTRPVS